MFGMTLPCYIGVFILVVLAVLAYKTAGTYKTNILDVDKDYSDFLNDRKDD